MSIRLGRQMKDWLKDVTKDQNLEKIADIEAPVLTSLRRWFVTRMIGLQVKMGYYDDATGRLVLGNPGIRARFGTPTLAASAVSQATYTITGAANGTLVKNLTHSNATRAPLFKLTLSDGTTSIDIREPNAADFQTVQNQLVGDISATAATALSPAASVIHKEIYLPSGWTLVSTDANFVAADVMRAESSVVNY